MLQYFVVITVSVCLVASNKFGPKYVATKGEVWPKPKAQITENTYYNFVPVNFNITVTENTCSILTNAIERCSFLMKDMHSFTRRFGNRNLDRKRRSTDPNSKGSIQMLEIKLAAPCEQYPYFGMDESYTLTVKSHAELTSSSIWGILRGLETWTQLFYFDNDEIEIRINKTDIADAPRYIHRGLLIDTSRHFISLSNIQKTLDAMAMNKLNVLHWHIVDDQSFPYQSEKFPDLSRKGAYHSNQLYSKAMIKLIINYARDRGIRVLPEFDVPGHTASWGKAFPNILTTCYSYGVASDLGPMNPMKNITYKLLEGLFTEVQDWFPDKYFHVGGDEVDLTCWKSNPELQRYMRIHNMASADELHALFMKNVIPLLGRKSTPIVWQEVFDEGVPLPKDTLIQVWKGGETLEMISILQAGYKVLFSSAWYLDHVKSGDDWQEYYLNDPRQLVSLFERNDINLGNIVGGEACMWGEMVNDMSIISRVWPRASAVAEKLWSPETSIYHIPESVYKRLEEHTCRMNRRGIHAQPPSGPGFCVGADLVSARELFD